MKTFIFMALILFCISSFSFSGESNVVQLPRELQTAYDEFVLSMKSGDSGDINGYCLPHSVNFTYELRKDPEYGQDINVPFAKNSFDGTIVSVRKDAENCFLIRTNTTALWFVETKSLGWKLYRYLDKPIL